MIGDTNGSYRDGLPLSIYYSKKKGLSFVIGGSETSPLKKRIEKLVVQIKTAVYNSTGSRNQNSKLHSWSRWIGTDESGKGDFFGPLVVSGFYCDNSIINELITMNAIDSKMLTDKQIITIAHQIYAKFKDRIVTISLKPEVYNKLYSKFFNSGKKLNELMAWMHSRVIVNLTKKFPVDGVLIDKFTSDYNIRNSLNEMKNLNLLQATKAESDLGVAAASIISRYHFLQGLTSLSKFYNVKLPKGANYNVITAGKEFLTHYPEDKLVTVCKTHFKTYNTVVDR